VNSRTIRAVAFSLTGIAFFMYWIVVRPTTSASATQSQWPYVLWFSATILTLTLAIPMYGRMIGGRWVTRLAAAAGAAALMNSAVNIIEDGFGQDWAFLLFALGSAAMLLSLIALSAVLALGGRGARRMLALIPFGTAAGIVLFVNAGGVILLVTWLGAAGIAMRWEDQH
jgi:hypothetical protein